MPARPSPEASSQAPWRCGVCLQRHAAASPQPFCCGLYRQLPPQHSSCLALQPLWTGEALWSAISLARRRAALPLMLIRND